MAQRYDPSNTAKLIDNLNIGSDRFATYGLSPRQQQLNRLWSVYRAQQYDVCRFDWDGREMPELLDFEVTAVGGIVPQGFQTVGRDFPLKYRKPTAPYALISVIVDRFTELLFGERRHPKISVPGGEDTEDFLHAVAEAARLWPSMLLARTYGGAMGSVAVGFKFVNGKPQIEVHDPRWCLPTFKDERSPIPELLQLEKKYQFPKEVWNKEKRKWEIIPFWYRRVIDVERDVTYMEVEVDPEVDEPQWTEDPKRTFTHNFGFCPVVWVQNLPLQDEFDGDTDCPPPVYDQSHAIDMLVSQANRGTVFNADPTLHVADDADMDESPKTGSDNTIKTSANGQVKYVELEGTAPKAAVDLAREIRGMALEVAQCVLDNPEIGDRATATEVVHRFSAMLAKAGKLREQYGERCVKPLLEMIVRASRMLVTQNKVDQNGRPVTTRIVLPKKAVADENGNIKLQERKLGPPEADGEIYLRWPPYFDATVSDVAAASEATAAAFQAGLIDKIHAVNFLAVYFHVEDTKVLLAALEREAKEKQQQLEDDLQRQIDAKRQMENAKIAARGRDDGTEA